MTARSPEGTSPESVPDRAAQARAARLAPVIAHRGASAEAPENTLAAIALAADQGALAVEIDVSTSVDDVAYVHHDERLERCTTGVGLLHENDAATLDRLHAGIGRPGHEREPLPRLSAVIELVLARGLALNLEIKPPRGFERDATLAICRTIEREWPDDARLVFSSFSRTALATAREVLHSVPRALLVGAIPADWAAALEAEDSINLHCAANGFDAGRAAALRGAGYGLYCYTVNDVPTARRLLDAGAEGVFTDYPARLLAGLDA